MFIYIEKNWKYDSIVKYIMMLFIVNNFDLNYYKNCWLEFNVFKFDFIIFIIIGFLFILYFVVIFMNIIFY